MSLLAVSPETMALSPILAGSGTQFIGDLRLGSVESKMSKRFRDPLNSSSWNKIISPHLKCTWKTATVSSFNFTSRNFLCLATRKGSEESFFSNLSEDTDDVYDDLFKKYGKVVFKRNDQKLPTAEVDDDAESLSFAVSMAKVASDVKAADIRVLFVKPLVYWTRFFIIATAFSRPQIDAIGSRIRDLAETKYGRIPTGDSKPNSWTLLDFGDVVIHIFLPPQRAFYNLEEFYGNATSVDLPFENQPPFGS